MYLASAFRQLGEAKLKIIIFIELQIRNLINILCVVKVSLRNTKAESNKIFVEELLDDCH